MISRSIIEDYKKVFVLCLEVAGEKTGNKLLLNVEKNLDDQLVYSIINDLSKIRDVSMGEVICIMLSTLLISKVLGITSSTIPVEIDVDDMMSSVPDIVRKVSNEAADIYIKYLKIASEKFCLSRGIDLRIDFKNMSNSIITNN